jgi:hypothetical protein
VIVITHSGCGVPTSLDRVSSDDLLALQYDPDQWPGQPNAFTNAPDHFGQWMAHIAHFVTEELRLHPELLARLTPANHEFLVWLLRQYLGRRQSETWLQFLRTRLAADAWQALSDKANTHQLDHLYGDTVAELYGQIEECLEIAQHLDWKGIYARIDVNWADWVARTPDERKALAAGAKQILTSLTPLQRAGFGIKMGLHSNLLSLHETRDLVRGRAVVTAYEWAPDQLTHIVDQLIRLATGGQLDSQALLPADIWETFAKDVRAIWDAMGPAAAAVIASQLLEARTQSLERREQVVRRNLYRHSAMLHLDRDMSQRLVWRGMTPIVLDDTPFRVFELLWRHRGDPVSNEALLDITGTIDNLNQNISRIRRAIEPFKEDKSYIYVQRSISNGTWLEKKVCRFI